MPIRIKCRFCDELVNDKTNHFCASRRSYIGCDSQSEDFELAFISANCIGDLYQSPLPAINSNESARGLFDDDIPPSRIW